MHGFNTGCSMVKELCTVNDIILLQEHWLMTNNLHKLNEIDLNFQVYAVSSMNNKCSQNILIGRPFGGVAILFRKSFINNIKIMSSDEYEGRYLSVKLKCAPNDIIITNVYFPTNCAQNEYVCNVSNLHSYIENLFDNNCNALHLIAGDFNFDCDVHCFGYTLFKNILDDYNVVHCKLSSNSIQYTFCNTLQQTSCIDHVFVSEALHLNVFDVVSYDCGFNLSDHLPILCTLKCSLSSECKIDVNNTYDNTLPPLVCKDRWDKADTDKYYLLTGELLQKLKCSDELFNCNEECNNVMHQHAINTYYKNIVDTLKEVSALCVPRIPVRALKPYWNEELNQLKDISISMHSAWKSAGSPRSGIINDARMKAKNDYKMAIKHFQCECDHNFADDLGNLYISKQTKNFWKLWASKHKKRPVNTFSIEGQSDHKCIAEKFKNYYSQIYVNSNEDKSAVNEFNQCFVNLKDKIDSRLNYDFDISVVESCIKALKSHKAAGHDGLCSEHLLFSHPAIVLHLKILFSKIMSHGYVPDDFGRGLILPIVKNRLADLNATDNYRPITLSPVISKVFEMVMVSKFSNKLYTDKLQFGFKRDVGCNTALFVLHQVVSYFNDRGSNVYISSLDATKAFDRVNHFMLFSTLIKRGLPLCFIRMIVNWYSKLFVQVKWESSISSRLLVLSGVRQGGILSPLLFNVYVDCIISKLRESKLGCSIKHVYVGCIMYADDLLLISSSIFELQCMLNVCGDLGHRLGIIFNGSKSSCLMIGPSTLYQPGNMFINGSDIMWDNKLKYLGIFINNGRHFSVDLALTRRSFFKSVNYILSNCKFMSDLVKLELLEKHCLPILGYCIESLPLNCTELKAINSWWNMVYRKIFNYNKWESVRCLISNLGRLDLIHIINLKTVSFIKKLILSDNSMLTNLVNIAAINTVHRTVNYCGVNLDWSCGKIKSKIFEHFQCLCL